MTAQTSKLFGLSNVASNGWLAKLTSTSNELTPLIARVALGAVIFPHGAQKALGWFGGHGFTGTMGFFTNVLHIPAPFALLAITAEFLGAIGLLVGAFSRVAAFGIAVTMAVAALMAHAGNGFFMNWTGAQAGEGFEFHLLAIALAAIVMVKGAGRWSFDRVLGARKA